MRITGFSMGLISGAILGMLFAPAKGSTTRQKVKDTAVNIKEKFEHLLGITTDELDELKDLLEDEGVLLTKEDRAKLVKLIEESKNVITGS